VLLLAFVVLAACSQTFARTTDGSTGPPKAVEESVWCAEVDTVRERIRSVYRAAPNDGVWQNGLRGDVGDGLKEIIGDSPAEIHADILALGGSQTFLGALVTSRFDLKAALLAHRGLAGTTSEQAARVMTWLGNNCPE
jgi:hypothetical protein